MLFPDPQINFNNQTVNVKNPVFESLSVESNSTNYHDDNLSTPSNESVYSSVGSTCLILEDVLLPRAIVITSTRDLFTKVPLLAAVTLVWSNSNSRRNHLGPDLTPRRYHRGPHLPLFPLGYHHGYMFMYTLQHQPLSAHSVHP